MLEVNMEDVLVHLKAVFEACDQNGDGFVKTQDLLRLGQEHSSVGFEEMKTLIEKLDPEENGRISFDGFCKGIHDFLGVNGDIILNGSGNEAHDFVDDDSYPRLTISAVENDQQEDSCCERDSTYSTTSTNEYNGDDDDNFPDELQTSNFSRNQKQYSTFPPPTGPRLKHRATLPAMNVDMYSDRYSHSDTSEYQSEEGFEGYGESFSEDTAFEDSPTLRRERPFENRLYRGSGSRRTSAAAAALSSHNMHLFKCHSENPSRHNSFDDLIGDRALSDSEAGTSMFLLTELKRLSSQVSVLQEDHAMQTDKQYKIREENKLLCSRINALEEQIESQKVTTGKQVEEESFKYKLALNKLERENEESLEALNRKLLQAEEEIENLKKVEPLLRKELDTCQEEKRRLVKQVDSLELALQIKADEVAELKAKLEEEIKGRLHEQSHHEEELALASERMAELEKYKYEVDLKLKDHHSMEQQKTDLERHVQSLIKENLSLKNSKEELNVQLHQDGYFGAGQQGSLADELVTADKEKIISTLRDQEEENRRLRGYLDGLLMMIMEHNPALLELQ